MKRFTDSDKWKSVWFRKLPPKYKLLLSYLTDQCDNAGVWGVDLEMITFQIGEKYQIEETLEILKDEIISFDCGKKWYLKSFIEKQYKCDPTNIVSPNTTLNNLYKSVLFLVEKHGILSLLKDSDKVPIRLSEGSDKVNVSLNEGTSIVKYSKGKGKDIVIPTNDNINSINECNNAINDAKIKESKVKESKVEPANFFDKTERFFSLLTEIDKELLNIEENDKKIFLSIISKILCVLGSEKTKQGWLGVHKIPWYVEKGLNTSWWVLDFKNNGKSAIQNIKTILNKLPSGKVEEKSPYIDSKEYNKLLEKGNERRRKKEELKIQTEMKNE